jgi:hypothetical protein
MRASIAFSAGHDIVRNVPDLQRGLRLQHTYQVRVAHRRQRMVAHARLAQQLIADEKVTLENSSAVFRERRACDGEAAPECRHECFGHRSDVARGRRVESRTVLEVDLPRAAGAEVIERRQRLRDSIGCRRRARLQRDHNGVRIIDARLTRHTDRLNRTHPSAHEIVREIGRAGEIVSDAAEQHGCRWQRDASWQDCIMRSLVDLAGA